MHRRPAIAAAILTILALLAPMLGPAGLLPTPRALASTGGAVPRVVVVVGPTHSLTASDLQWGEAVAKRAEAHGAQVVRVFHPHATWSAVSAAAVGANILVYLGHGNGFPSPYTASLMPDRQDGMGLDPTDGASDSDVKYYGEQYMATLRLAANSLVLLNHLCYASGNSEPGQPDPTPEVAIQRVDNFAAGFLAGGAAAVISLGHQDAGDIVDALYGPGQTLDQLFMSTGGIGTFQTTVASARSSGARLHLDPEAATAYYRSIAGNLDLPSSDVLGGAVTTPPPSPGPPPPPAAALPPALMSLTGSSAFSPNGDGIGDTLTIAYSLTQQATLDVSVLSAYGQPVRHMFVANPGTSGRFAWDGRDDGGAVVPDGAYTVVATPTDGSANGAPLTVATRVLTALKSPTVAPAVFYPLDRDGIADRTTLGFTLTQPATVTWTVTDTAGNVLQTLLANQPTSPGTITAAWDGTGSLPGAGVPSAMKVGKYYSAITVTTAAGSVLTRSLVYLMSFRITPSASTVRAGQTLTVTIVAAERLRAAPRLVVTQPGMGAYAVTAVSARGLTYRATVRLRAGAPGKVYLKVAGTDAAGHALATTTSLTLR